MHAQYEHSPPTSRSSTIATSSPCSASRPAATSPAGPAPITTTSKLRIAGTLPSALRAATISRAHRAPGDDRLRRGRFVGVVASRGTGGLVKPRQTTNAKTKTVAEGDHFFALAA